MSVSLCNNNGNRNPNTNLLLTEWEDCTGEFYWPEVVAVQTIQEKMPYDSFLTNGLYGKILTRKEPIRMFEFT